MGIFRVRIEVGDPQGSRFEDVDALVDTGASHSAAPASLLRRLGIEPYQTASFDMNVTTTPAASSTTPTITCPIPGRMRPPAAMSARCAIRDTRYAMRDE